jgi:septum formation protein
MQKNTKGCFSTNGQLILASSSPRRQQFLQELGIEFKVETVEIDESIEKAEAPKALVLRLSKEKAAAVSKNFPEAHVLAADTVVVIDGEILGKPKDVKDAERMLKRLSDRWHEVWTGFCVMKKTVALNAGSAVKTRVFFRELSDDLCRAYVLTGEPSDKAGGYGIQGKGGFLVEKIEGSHSNVIGLPVAQVVDNLLQYNIITPRLR